MTQHWFDRLTAPIAPIWTLKRQRARAAAEIVARHFEGASTGRRTQGWNRTASDVNAANGPALSNLRNAARDLVRNNPYAESAIATICDHTVGWGIVAKSNPTNVKAMETWNAWAGTTACDADGRHDLYGLQKLVLSTVVESGEVLVRRRFRRPEDGFPLPLQLQVLEPDFLDTTRDTIYPNGAGRVVQGVEYDAIGRRTAYWLYPEHPGGAFGSVGASVRVPAESILHIFKGKRPGQARGASWFAPVLLRFKDFDDYEDATLMKQKIAACLSVITSDLEGSATPLGTADAETGLIDELKPGMILNVPTGRSVNVVQPPTVREHGEFCEVTLRAIATGLGVTYEDLTGDYTDLPFSAARMSRMRHWSRVDDWRWRLMIPQFCDPVWGWVMQTATVLGKAGLGLGQALPSAVWTAPPMPMIDPAAEGLAYARNVRAGIQTLSEAIRERGYDPAEMLKEMAEDNKRLDRLGLILDSDARKMTQAGQLQGAAAAAPAVPVVEEDADADRRLRLA